MGSKLYIWDKKQRTLEQSASVAEKKKKEGPPVDIPKLSDGKLRELSWKLDINDDIDN